MTRRMKIAYWALLGCIAILAVAEVISMAKQDKGMSREFKAKLECEKIIPFKNSENLMKLCIEEHMKKKRHPGW